MFEELIGGGFRARDCVAGVMLDRFGGGIGCGCEDAMVQVVQDQAGLSEHPSESLTHDRKASCSSLAALVRRVSGSFEATSKGSVGSV